MTSPLLNTKLYNPPPRPGSIPRQRLIERLNQGLSRKLTLVSAPAGFGKTTLVSSWIEQVDGSVAWFSLDESDNELSRFLTYLIAALQTIEGELGQGAFAALQSPETVNTEAVLTVLLNELAQVSERIVLVLDDYHVIECPPIDQATTFLLEHLPPQIHLVIASRIDPTLPLSRLRVRRQMAEIRVNDLRFTPEEAQEFFNQTENIILSAKDVTALEARTEGWIAGLQLAALSIQGLKTQDQVASFVDRFTGSDRYIHDYLVDEVLQQQPDNERDFLLQTSILERMCAPLCDALLNGHNNQTMLESIETANLFIVPLDNQRHWYRYHHLFAGLLKHRLKMTYPDRVSNLHRRASVWYQDHNYIDDAIHHAQASESPERLSEILEEKWQVIIHRGEFAKLKGLLVALGPDITQRSAPLSMAYCWIFALTGEIEAIPKYIEDIKSVLNEIGMENDNQQPNKILVIPSLVETIEAIIALEDDQAEKAKDHAIKAMSIIPDVKNPEVRGLLGGAAGYRLAEAHIKLGEFEEAYQVLFEVFEMLKMSDNYYGAVAALQQIVAICQKLGKVRQAISLCEDMLRFMQARHWQTMPPCGVVYVILADLQLDFGKIEDARKNLDVGRNIVNPIESAQIRKHIFRVEEKLARTQLTAQPLVEPLSERELEVLVLISQGLTNREISEKLFLALDTIKGHNRRIFGKLGVQNRTEAARRARELGLI